MARVHPLIESFNAGEFGARMEARVSFGKYPAAGRVYQNLLPLPQGGWSRRPGWRYVAAVEDHTVRSWLVPFRFSDQQAYILELGEQIIRFYRNQAQIVAPDVASNTAVSNGTFDSGITNWTDQSNGTGSISYSAPNDWLELNGAGSGNEGIAEQRLAINNADISKSMILRFQVAGDPGDEITVRMGTTSGGEQVLADTVFETGWHTVEFTASDPYLQFECGMSKTVPVDNIEILDDAAVELTTPWSESDLPTLSFAQSADVVYFASGGSTRVYRLERRGHSEWSLMPVLFEDGPFLDENTTSTTLTPSATSGNDVQFTASSTTGINGGKGFREADEGRLIRIKDAANNWTWVQITQFNSTTNVTGDILGPDLSSAAARSSWRLGEWNDTDGWPAVVGFIQQRLALGNTAATPQKMWLSESSILEGFADSDTVGDVLDTSSFSYILVAKDVHAIRWFITRKQPIVGTVGGVWTMRSDGAVLTPTDVAADLQTSTGSAAIIPVNAKNRVIYTQEAKRKIEEFADILTESGVQGFDSFDLTLLNDRVYKNGQIQMAYAEEPDSEIWSVRDDGQVPVLSYQPDQKVIGWSRQILGGSYLGGDPVVESIAVIPGNDGSGQFKDSTGRHEVWVVVRREINGSAVRYIEVLEKAYNGDEDLQQDAFYVDSGLTLNSPIDISGVTQADPGVLTTDSAHGLSDGDTVIVVRVKGMTELNDQVFTVANSTSTTFELTDSDGNNIDTTGYSEYKSGGEIRKRVTTVSGADHLEGETVQVFADGAIQTTKTVTNGSITLDNPAGLVHIGLSYEHRWKSLKLAVGAQAGTSVGKHKNLPESTIVLLETGAGNVEVTVEDEDGEGEFWTLDIQEASDYDDTPPPFATGEYSLGIETGFDPDLRFVVKGSEPVPCTVLAIAPELQTNDIA